jgi:THO complex subunit 1
MTDESEVATPGDAEAGQTESPLESAAKIPKVIVSGNHEKNSNSNSKEDVDLDALYPVFWSLQAYFSAPSKVFDSERFASFKAGLEATLSAFKNINTEIENQSAARASEDARKSNKRKRIADGAEVASSFNPKYLTSRDLFDLEVSDTAFRRHVLVQALILLDFVLSLTSKSKSRLADATNKSVLYGFTLNDEDTKWAVNMRKSIEGYLQQGPGGMFYYRMVNTVLSRDKNWVRWKAEGCPLIERPAISAAEYKTSREHATKAYANKRIRPSPMGSLDLKFLADNEALANIERLKQPDRYSVPTADSFLKGIMDDEMDIEMAMTNEDKEIAVNSKASKSWRILRLSAKGKLAAFDKIEDGNKLQALFESPTAEGTPHHGEEANESGTRDERHDSAKDSLQGLDGVQDTPTGKEDPVPSEQSDRAKQHPQDMNAVQDTSTEKNVISERNQDPSVANNEEALAASSAFKEDPAT